MKNKKMSKVITLCADDFGQNTAICEGILALAALKRINAISCLVNFPAWFEHYAELMTLPDSCAIGLHFNLTCGQALSDPWRSQIGGTFAGLSNLIQKTSMRAFDPHVIHAELKAQLMTFIETMDRHPDFIDGHQHVHQLPQVRDALIRLYQDEGLSCRVRKTHNGCSDQWPRLGFFKVQALAWLGGRRFSSLLSRSNIPSYAHFSGVYSFSGAKNYRRAMQSFLAHTRDGGLIMCHPGLASDDRDDAIRASRPLEWAYLMSEAFDDDLAKASCTRSTTP